MDPAMTTNRLAMRLATKARALSGACAFAVGMIASMATPAEAQSGRDETIFVDLGRWTIVEHPSARYCEMRLRNGGLVYSKRDGRPGSLRLSGSRSSFAGGEVVFAFDDTSFGGQMIGSGVYAPTSDSTAIEQRFRQARTLSVRQGEQVVASLSLKTSAAGFRLLKQCSEQWRFPQFAAAETRTERVASRTTTTTPSSLRSEPRPRNTPPAAQVQPSPQTQPQSSGPFPPNRALRPLNPANWVTADDLRRFSRSRRTPGTLSFTLLVDERGRAQECAVDQSSGSRDFDADTCRALIRNARFEPATDSNGNARQSTFSSNVKFAIE